MPRLQVKRGAKADLPTSGMLAGEPHVTTDRGTLHVALNATTKLPVVPPLEDLATIGTVDNANDLLLIHDASEGAAQKEKKITFAAFKTALDIVGGGGGTPIVVTPLTLDFGTTLTSAKTFVVTTPATIGKTAIVTPSIDNGDELEFDNFSCAASVTNTDEVTITVTAHPGPVMGTRAFELVLLPESVGGGGAGIDALKFDASEFIPRTTDGCGIDSQETATNKINRDLLAFDTAAIEYAQVWFPWPTGWATAKLTFFWKTTSGTGSVVWGGQILIMTDGDAEDQAFGTAQTVTDAAGSANTHRQTAATSAITPSGTVTAGKAACLQIYRNATSGSDDLGVDAFLQMVLVEKSG
jgi:hypothetical protein